MSAAAGEPERVEVALAIPLRAGRVLVARRGEAGAFPGLWEFPGGKLDPGETPDVAALRELREETRLEAGRLDPLVVVVHDDPERSLRLHVYVAPEPAGEPRIDGGREWGWHELEALESLPMPPVNREIVRALRWRVAGGRRP